MKTNLIFKRQVNIDGITKVVTRVVHVDIPDIESGEGWTLSGHSDIIEVCDKVYTHPVAPKSAPVISNFEIPEDPMTGTVAKADSIKFESDVKGTAKLVRSKGVIKITARRGKTTYNQTTPNSVCIDDFTKNNFFKDCRAIHGDAAGLYEFRCSDGKPYDYWNNVIDKEYQRQKDRYNNCVSSI